MMLLTSYFVQLKLHNSHPSFSRECRFEKRPFTNRRPITISNVNVPCHVLEFVNQCKCLIANSTIYCNSCTSDCKTFKRLKGNRNIVIAKADKGSITVVLSKNDYDFEAFRQLADTKFYIQIFSSNNESIVKDICNIVDILYRKKYITTSQHNFLRNFESKDRQFYLLPKVHKPKTDWHYGPNDNLVPPGRPIISDVNSVTYQISKYINTFLLPLAKLTDSYLIDTDDFILKLSDLYLPRHCYLFTLDVKSLYTNIPINEGIDTVKLFFERFPDPKRPDQHLLDLMRICLCNHEFMFNNNRYLQRWGTAMGTPFAPNYANLYLSEWENLCYLNYCTTPYFWVRYIDDIFGILASQR